MKQILFGFLIALVLVAFAAFVNPTGIVLKPYAQFPELDSLPSNVGPGTICYFDGEFRCYGEDGWKVLKQFNH